MKNIIIDPEFKALIPPLSEDEKDNLFRSICAYGIRDALTVWKETSILLDGHNRWEYVKTRGPDLEPAISYLSFPSRDFATDWVIRNQLSRRNVTPEVAKLLRGKLMELRKVIVTNPTGKNQYSEVKYYNNTQPDTAEKVAKETGVTRDTVLRNARLVRALAALGLSEADYIAGRITDANGKKRSDKSIIEEAYPKKKKAAYRAEPVPPVEENEPNQDHEPARQGTASVWIHPDVRGDVDQQPQQKNGARVNAESEWVIRNKDGNEPTTKKEWQRLHDWLVAIKGVKCS